MDTTPTNPTTATADGTGGQPAAVPVGGYLVPVDPMEDLDCDACQ